MNYYANPFSIEIWACLLMVIGIVAQPFLSGPDITGQNASRLTSLSLVPLVLAFAFLLKQQKLLVRGKILLLYSLLAIILIAFGSFHHFYTAIRWPNSQLFAAFQMGIATVMGWVELQLHSRHQVKGLT